MKMTFRWYGSNSDSVTLKQIKQIPGMTGIMGFLDYKAAGEVWNEDEIKSYIDEVHAAGLECEVIESVNVHEDIKLGLPTRDAHDALNDAVMAALAFVKLRALRGQAATAMLHKK